MTTTIPTEFDPTALPAWAQRIPAVVEKCKTNLAYRCDVCGAVTEALRKFLARQAAQ